MDNKLREQLLYGAEQLEVEIDESKLEKCSRFEELIEVWSGHTNLVSAGSRESFIAHHILDSLSCLMAGIPKGSRVIDIGSGAGLPGIPVAIVREDIRLTMLDSMHKRCDFLEKAVHELPLDGAKVICERAETFGHRPDERETYDVGLIRAVAPLPVVLEYVLPLLKVGGVCIAQRGTKAKEEAEGAGKIASILGGRITETRRVVVPFVDRARYLVIVHKVETTSDVYPRRVGVPLKRPLKG
jgi:16S rRNA (guanine527-N7)-methyltransferase